MWKILKYSLFDMVRSRWLIIYALFFMVAGYIILYLGSDISKGIASLMNLTLILTPLMGTLFGVINFYNSREFIELLLAQPIRRKNIFLGMYLGFSISLSLAFMVGLGIPFLSYGLWYSGEIANFLSLLLAGIFLTFIFSAFAFLIAIYNENRLKGFGISILFWLIMAFAYDGIFLISLILFEDYPLEKLSIMLSSLNPIDLSRILVMLKLDLSALMGYTGAVFRKFFGTSQGIMIAYGALLVWTFIPVRWILHVSKNKDF
ncbi:MAG: ABC transporter permease [Cyclobacteriaceae bacterium]|nr:ABC transporter permease [Cyclobacteriaceae bacterium]